jgi:outer membrane protein assembly factor BamB
MVNKLESKFNTSMSGLTILGVVGGATFNRTIDTIYVVGGNGTFYAISMKTDNTLWSIPDAYVHTVLSNYGSLTLYNDMVYATFASHCDEDAYYGGVWIISVITRSVVRRFFPNGNGVGGGVWGLGGVTINPNPIYSDTKIYIPIGNSIGSPDDPNVCGSIVETDLNLNVIRSVKPPSYIDPTYDDDDFGSTALYFNGPSEAHNSGCQSAMAAASRKDGLLVIVRLDTCTNVQNIVIGDPSGGEYIQQGAWDQDLEILVIPNNAASNLSNFGYGVVGFKLNSTCHLNNIWNTALNARLSSPTIVGSAGHRVAIFGSTYFFTVIDVQTGENHLTMNIPSNSVNAPAIVNDVVFLPGFTPGYLMAFGLPAITSVPTIKPSFAPISKKPSFSPTVYPTAPTNEPRTFQTSPTMITSLLPTTKPTLTYQPSFTPSIVPTAHPTVTSKPSVAPIPLNSPNSNASNNGENSGLPHQVLVGITIAVVVIGVVALLITFCFFPTILNQIDSNASRV